MKHFAKAALVVALSIMPIGAFADTPPMPGGPGSGPMDQVRGQIDQVRSRARSSALNALTPPNRTLLGQVVGQLAMAQTPDVAAAVKSLDASLSPQEAKAILDAQNALEAQTRAIIDKARAAAGGPSGPGGPGMGGPRTPDEVNTDAGLALLRLAVPHLDPPRIIRVG